MKLCLNSSTIKPQPIMDKIRLAGEAGFEGLEIWINEVYDFIGRGGEVRDIEKALADHGLIVPSVIAIRLWGDMEGWEHQLVKDEARRRFALGARLGAPFIVATPPLERTDIGHLPERYVELLEIGREEGIRPTFEYISFFKSVWRLRQAWQIVLEAEDEDATIILDAFHTWNSASSIDEYRSIPVERISHFHIDDAHPSRPQMQQIDPDRQMVGDGPIDLKAELALLKEMGYDGCVSLELFNQELWKQDPLDVLKRGLDRIQSILPD